MAYEWSKNLNTSVKGIKLYNIFLNKWGMTIEQTSFGWVVTTINMILNIFSSKKFENIKL